MVCRTIKCGSMSHVGLTAIKFSCGHFTDDEGNISGVIAMKKPALVATLSLLSLSVAAASVEPTLRLDDTVVTGTGFEVASLMSPGSISRISREQVQGRTLADVAELFRDIPGVVLTDADTPA